MTEPRFPKSPADYPSPAEYGRASGLERVLGMNDGRFPAAPMAKTAGLRLLEATEGRVVFEGLPTFEQYNPMGSVHGGWFGILLDSAMGCAIMTRLPEGLAYTTLEYKVNLLRPAHADTGPLHGIGEALHVAQGLGHGGRLGRRHRRHAVELGLQPRALPVHRVALVLERRERAAQVGALRAVVGVARRERVDLAGQALHLALELATIEGAF